MTLTLGWPQITFLVALFLAWNGFLVEIIRRLFISKVNAFETKVTVLEVNTQENQALKDKVAALEKSAQKNHDELAQLRADMPVLYERREDAIRAYTVINAKLDRLYELLAGKT